MLIGITAGFHHEHAVLRVENGTRLTMPFFLTFDPQKSDAHCFAIHSADVEPMTLAIKGAAVSALLRLIGESERC